MPAYLLQPFQFNNNSVARIEIAEDVGPLPAQKIRAYAHAPMIAHSLRESRADQILLLIQAGQNKQLRPERVANKCRANRDRGQPVVARQQQILLARGSE